MSFDLSELSRLTADLGKGNENLLKRGRQAIEVTARKVKDEAQKLAANNNSARAKRYPRTISYDFVPKLGSIEVEIGPALGGQGSLGGILEDGTVRNRAQGNLTNALQANREDFEKGVAIAAADALRDSLK